eukprot:PITA_17284
MIRSLTKKKGGTRKLGRDSISFQNFMDNMGLVDTETTNGTFTWNNKRGGASQAASKLDRFIISYDLFVKVLDMLASILPFGGSDHWYVQLEATFMGTPRNIPFRFENVWLSHPDFTNNIDKWWVYMPVQGTKMFRVSQRLKHIKSRLKDWNKKEFGNIFKAKREVEENLQEINEIIIPEGFTEEQKIQDDSLQNEWDDQCMQESHNIISKLKDSKWKEFISHKEMESVLVQHFLSIAEEPLIDRSRFINKFTKFIPNLVTREDKPVSEEDVSEVINEMQNGKAPGPNGFNVDFFKACWKIVK